MRYIFLQQFEIQDDGDTIKGTLPVTKDWEVFQDHFPGFPIMPGALILETMAQHCVALMLEHKQGDDPVVPTLIQVDRAKFKEPVFPDCTLDIEVKKEIAMYPNFKFSSKASVNNRVVSEARLTMAFRDVGMGQGLDFMGFFFKGMQK